MATTADTSSADPDPKSGMDWFIHHVFDDPEFIAEIEALSELEKQSGASPELDELKQDIAKKFGIAIGQINRFIISQTIPLSHKVSSASLDHDFSKGEFEIKLSAITTKPEMLEQWDKFEHIRNALFPMESTKRRPPKHPDLLYAVFKCRQFGLTFPEIFKLYSIGELPGYTGSHDGYMYEETLERYYNKYKPTAYPDT